MSPFSKKTPTAELAATLRNMGVLMKLGKSDGDLFALAALDAKCPALASRLEALSRKAETGGIDRQEVNEGFAETFGSCAALIFSSDRTPAEKASALNLAADELERIDFLWARFRKQLRLPLITLIVGLVVLDVMGGFVLPAFGKMFLGMGGELPASTQAVLAFGDLFNKFGGVVNIVLFAAIFYFWRSDSAKQKLINKLPLLGRSHRDMVNYTFLRYLSLMLDAGLEPAGALAAAADNMGDPQKGKTLKALCEGELTTETLAEKLEGESLLSRTALEALAAGGSGDKNLALLTEAADAMEKSLEREGAKGLEWLIFWIYAAVIAAMTLMILGLYMPIFSMAGIVG